MRVGVIGAGISGITAAYLIGQRHDVTLIERCDRIGGHTNTIVLEEESGPLPVDIGFIVCNPQTYPHFYRLLREWNVDLRDTEMSFGFHCEATGVGYVGPSVREFLRKPANMFSLALLGLLREQRRFNRRASDDLAAGDVGDRTLAEYLKCVGASRFFIDHYLVPLAASVWSSPDGDMLQFPAATFLRFFANHGMLNFRERPRWQTIRGGSHAYLKAFLARFRGQLATNAPVSSIIRDETGVTVCIEGSNSHRFDHVVLATHADVSLRLLSDATPDERFALSAWNYHCNRVHLHTDSSVMPADRRLWASWNYHRRDNADVRAPVTITYWMNRLQGLGSAQDYFVSLNAEGRLDPDRILHAAEFSHPGYTPRSVDAQERLRALSGARRTHFCGAHMRYGFHEDGVASAVDVARFFGAAA